MTDEAIKVAIDKAVEQAKDRGQFEATITTHLEYIRAYMEADGVWKRKHDERHAALDLRCMQQCAGTNGNGSSRLLSRIVLQYMGVIGVLGATIVALVKLL